MNKKQLFIIIMMIILIIPTVLFAFAGELIENPKPEVPEDISTIGGKILGAVQWVGYGIAVGMLLYIAIKYMMSAANEKADLKQHLINYLIGAIIIIGVVAIFTAIAKFFGVDVKEAEGAGINTESSDVSSPVIGGE